MAARSQFKPDGCVDARKATQGDKISVHYKGMLVDGSKVG